jgi:tetratricopeptide (TPR) repeat protein
MNRQQRRSAARQVRSGAPTRADGFGSRLGKMFEAALGYHRSGNLAEAERNYRQILSIDPNHSHSLHMLGMLAYNQGLTEVAIRQIHQAIATDTRIPEFHHNLGNIMRDAGRREEAAACYRRALGLKPDLVDTLYNLGNLCQDLGRADEAVTHFQRAAALKPDSVEILNNLGSALHDQGSLDAAVACYQKALSLRPDAIETLANYAGALHERGELGRAAEQYQRALALRPDYIDVMIGLGTTLREQGKMDAAIAHFKRGLALAPDRADAHNNLAVALEATDNLPEAIAHYERAVALSPDQAEIHNNLGNALEHQGRLDEAMACYQRALSLKPDYAEAHYNRSLLLLLLGDFAGGWAEYEWRWRCKANPEGGYPTRPLWAGEPPAGRTILIQTEQGFGDSFQFLRYVPAVAERGAKVVLAVPGPLLRLAEALPGVSRLVTEDDPLPDFDFYCPLLSLPHAFGTKIDTIPASVPYLAPPADTLAAWGARLRAGTDLKIGLVWSGNPANRMNPSRSLPFAALQPLWRIPGVRWHSLQVGSPAADISLVPPGTIEDLSPFLTDFAETAAAICHLDLVISVETAVAHLAGALGRPVWVPLTVVPAWRWLLGREDSPWYPTMRLFRQTTPGDWTPVVDALAERLTEMARGDEAGR